MGNKHKATRHKNKPLSDYIYSIATLYCKVGLMPIKTGQFIKLCKIISHNLFLFYITANRGVFGTQTNIYGGVSLRKKLTVKI